MTYSFISGFADEICAPLDEQLAALNRMGLQYICLRAADRKGIADYTPEEAENYLLPKLREAGIGVSSLGSPIGKIRIDDEEGFQKQLGQLENLCKICKILDCNYIRIFSFFIPEGSDYELCGKQVIEKLRQFIAIAEKYGVVLTHENEKFIYGDIASRCARLLETLNGPHFKAAFDFANFVQCGEDPEYCWDLLKGYVEYIHIKDAVFDDNSNVLCGTGDGKIAKILEKAFCQEGYNGFLTLEPHLVVFSTFASLEKAAAEGTLKMNQYASGEEGFAAQYAALNEILSGINR